MGIAASPLSRHFQEEMIIVIYNKVTRIFFVYMCTARHVTPVGGATSVESGRVVKPPDACGWNNTGVDLFFFLMIVHLQYQYKKEAYIYQ